MGHRCRSGRHRYRKTQLKGQPECELGNLLKNGGEWKEVCSLSGREWRKVRPPGGQEMTKVCSSVGAAVGRASATRPFGPPQICSSLTSVVFLHL